MKCAALRLWRTPCASQTQGMASSPEGVESGESRDSFGREQGSNSPHLARQRLSASAGSAFHNVRW